MKDTKIEWTDCSFNPWVGCQPVSPGCAHCYAAALTKRWGRDFSQRTRTSATYWRQPLTWAKKPLRCNDCGTAESEQNRTGDPICGNCGGTMHRVRVFCGSMCDWMDDQVPDDWRADLMELIDATKSLDWLLLTKRPQDIERLMRNISSDFNHGWTFANSMPNVWIGTTIEKQEQVENRLPVLVQIPATIRFFSCEPLLEEIDLHLAQIHCADWVIGGGESGHHARPMNPEWARSLRDQCAVAGVPFFMKQMGGTRKPFAPIPADLNIKQFPRWREQQ